MKFVDPVDVNAAFKASLNAFHCRPGGGPSSLHIPLSALCRTPIRHVSARLMISPAAEA